MKNKTHIYCIILLFLTSLAFIGCDNDANGQSENTQDFIQNVISGSVIANLEGENFLIQLEVSPITTYITESPGLDAGQITTEKLFDSFFDIFGDVPPNSMLVLREEDGSVISVPITITNPNYDPSTGTVEITATPIMPSSPNTSPQTISLTSLVDLQSPFGPASFFIDGGSLFSLPQGPCGGLDICPGVNECCNLNSNSDAPVCCPLGGDVTCEECSCG